MERVWKFYGKICVKIVWGFQGKHCESDQQTISIFIDGGVNLKVRGLTGT